MEWLELAPDLMINVDKVVAIQKLSDMETRIYLPLEMGVDSISTQIPYSTLIQIFKSKAKQVETIARSVKQLAVHQSQQVP